MGPSRRQPTLGTLDITISEFEKLDHLPSLFGLAPNTLGSEAALWLASSKSLRFGDMLMF